MVPRRLTFVALVACGAAMSAPTGCASSPTTPGSSTTSGSGGTGGVAGTGGATASSTGGATASSTGGATASSTGSASSSSTGSGGTPPFATFTSAKVPSGGIYVEQVVVADMNGDAKLDLVVSNPNFHDFGGAISANVSVLLGKGDGTFNPPQPYAVGKHPEGITVGDFDGDGQPDIYVSSFDGLYFLHNGGGGTFTAAGPVKVHSGTWLRSGKLNGDTSLDLIMTPAFAFPRLNEIDVYEGVGDGTVKVPPTALPGVQPGQVELVDLNADGFLDLVAPDEGTSKLDVYLGGPGGAFGLPAVFPTAGNAASAVAFADFNGDGKVDLVANDFKLSLLAGNGDGTFGAPKALSAAQPGTIAVADFDSDGHADILTNAQTGLLLLRGHGDGTFDAPLDLGYHDLPGSLGIGDFNGDGKPDFAATFAPDYGHFWVYLNTTP
jgi:hypothetical protein